MAVTFVCKKSTGLHKVGHLITIEKGALWYLELLKEANSFSEHWEVYVDYTNIKQEKPKRKYLNRKESIAT